MFKVSHPIATGRGEVTVSTLRIGVGQVEILVEVFDTRTGRALLNAVPFSSIGQTWGD